MLHYNCRYSYRFKCKYVLEVIGTLGLGIIKLSVLFFYRRIFTVPIFRLVSNIVITIVIAWSLAFTLLMIFQCSPIYTHWTKLELHYAPFCINQLQVYLVLGISDLLLDCLIFILPLRMISGLHMPLRRKFAVRGIFLLGTMYVCSCYCSMAFRYTFSTYSNTTFSFSEYDNILWRHLPLNTWPLVSLQLALLV